VELTAALLIAVGFGVLIAAMWRTQRLIGILRDRPPWPSLRNLMGFFAISYAVYFYSLVSGVEVSKDLVVAEVFFLASLFMLLVVRFAYRTIHDIMRLDQLEQLANIDELTGLYNRRAILQLLDEEAWKARRFGFALSVAMVDLDNLKWINDTYLHSTGDTVLREIAADLRDGMRQIDIVGRYGGDEFLCVLPSTGLQGAAATAERIRERIADMRFQVIGDDEVLRLRKGASTSEDAVFGVSVSIGVAEYTAGMNTPAEAVSAADTALYQAKDAGRDVVITYVSS